MEQNDTGADDALPLTVLAGDYGRRHCPVQFSSPKPILNPRLHSLATGAQVACQYDDANRELWWMIGRLPAKATARFEASSDHRRRSPARVLCKSDYAGWRFTVRRRSVAEVLLSPSVPFRLTASAADRPAVAAMIAGGPAAYYRRRESTPEVIVGPVFGELSTEGDWVDGLARAIASESFTVRCFDTPIGLTMLDLEWRFEAKTGPVDLSQWRWTLEGLDDLVWKSPTGFLNHDLVGRDAPWIWAAGPRGGVTLAAECYSNGQARRVDWIAQSSKAWLQFLKDDGELLIGGARIMRCRIVLTAKPEAAASPHWFVDFKKPPNIEEAPRHASFH